MDRILAAQPLKVPTMLVDSLWDQEDIYGAPALYKALKAKETANDKVFLVLGPWHHGQEIGDGSTLGALKFNSDTGLYFRTQILRPFLDHYLKDGAPAALPGGGSKAELHRTESRGCGLRRICFRSRQARPLPPTS
jgi:predicted acyl esterase